MCKGGHIELSLEEKAKKKEKKLKEKKVAEQREELNN